MTAAPRTIAGQHVGSADPLLPAALAALVTGALAARAGKHRA